MSLLRSYLLVFLLVGLLPAGDLTVTTTAVSGITSTGATTGGNVSSNNPVGGVIERGVCWATTTNPTTARR